jgi:hypothetical protein
MAPNFGDRSIVMIEQGVIATAAFDAINRTIDSIAKCSIFLTASRALVEK